MLMIVFPVTACLSAIGVVVICPFGGETVGRRRGSAVRFDVGAGAGARLCIESAVAKMLS